MLADPLISVIIPVYNVEEYLNRCLDSVLGQTYRNLEVILVDDGSTDTSGEICEECAHKDERVRVFHQVNAGPSAARNKGLLEAKGEYIAFVDSDDYLEIEMYQCLYNVIVRNNADIAICNYFQDIERENVIVDHGLGDSLVDKEDIVTKLISRHFAGRYNGLFSPVNKLHRASFLRQSEAKFDTTRMRSEDTFFYLLVFWYANRIAFTDVALYHYSSNEYSIMHSFRRTQLKDWERNAIEALQMNKHLFHLELDYYAFYRAYITNSINYLADAFILMRKDRHEIVREFIISNFFREAIRHDKYAPLYARVFCWLVRKKLNKIVDFTLIIFSTLKKLKHQM